MAESQSPIGGSGGIPRDMVTSGALGKRRLRVDIGQTGFWEGREFRFDLEISAPIVVKFSSPVDFILQSQVLESRDGLATFEVYGASDGAEGGTFTGDGIINLPNNAMSDTPVYTQQTVITAGGTFTPNPGAIPRESIKVKASTSSAQRQTVGGAAIQERGLPAGDYYLMFTGDDASYNLVYEERP